MRFFIITALLTVFSLTVLPPATCFLHPAHAEETFNTPTAQAWYDWEVTHDKQNIARSSVMRTDSSPAILTVCEEYTGKGKREFTVAKEPPIIDFMIIQDYEPWYLPIRLQRQPPSWRHLGGIR